MREKLDEEFRRYRILGACDPSLAHEAVSTELSIGTLLPCDVIVYEADGGDVVVEAVDPEELLGLVGNPEIEGIAGRVRDRFERVLSGLD